MIVEAFQVIGEKGKKQFKRGGGEGERYQVYQVAVRGISSGDEKKGKEKEKRGRKKGKGEEKNGNGEEKKKGEEKN